MFRLLLAFLISGAFSAYVPGELLSGFQAVPLLPLMSEQKLTHVVLGSDVFPLTVFVTNLKADAWSKTALLSEESVFSFLLSDFAAGNSHYLFIPQVDPMDTIIIAESFQNAANVIVTEFVTMVSFDMTKMSRLLFANTTIQQMRIDGGFDGLLGPLDQWKTAIDQIAFTSSPSSSASTTSQFAVNVTRLDCAWPNCFTPRSGTGTVTLIDGGDFCTPFDPPFPRDARLNESYILVTANICNYETAAQNVDDLPEGVLGSIIIMREDEPTLLAINSDGAVPLNHGTAVTSVSYQDGMALKDKLNTLQQTGNKGEISFFSQVISGYFIVVDGKKRLQEIGSHKQPTLMLASWAMQYENYRCKVFAELAKPAYILPIISGAYSSIPATAAKDAIIIPRHEIERYGTMEIDTEITCPGLYDSDCSGWDHTVTLQVWCADQDPQIVGVRADGGGTGSTGGGRGLGGDGEVGGEPLEIARYITPFSRRSGRWITPATHFIPLLLSLPTSSPSTTSSFSSDGSPISTPKFCESFLFQASSVDWYGSQWIISSKMRFTDGGRDPPRRYSPLFAFSEYFRPAIYNVNRTLHIDVPQYLTLSPVRVELAVLITTHGSDEYGCCEFLPTKHVFTVNGVEFEWSFMEAGTEWGCADRTGEGSAPNEYGSWWYGRGNWCDGIDVKPLVVDVTAAAALSGQGTVEVTYRAYMLDVASYGSMDQRRGLGLGLSQEQRQRQRQGQEQSPTYAYGEDDGGYLNDDYNFSSSILGGDDDYDGYVPGGVPINWILPQSDDATGYVIMSSNLVYYYDSNNKNNNHAATVAATNSSITDSQSSLKSSPEGVRGHRLVSWPTLDQPQVLYWLIADGILHLFLLFLFCYYKAWKDCCSHRGLGPRGVGIRLGLISPAPQYTYVLEQSTHNAGDDETLGARETDRLSPPVDAMGAHADVMAIHGGDDDEFLP